MSTSEDSQSLNIKSPGIHWTGILLRVFSWLLVSLTLLFLVNNYLIFWRGWPGLWNFFAHQEWFGFSPLRTPLSDENQMLGWIQTIILILIIILNLLNLMSPALLKMKNKIPYFQKLLSGILVISQ